MSPHQNPAASLEALLRDACRRALRLGLSFTNQIRLCRSIIALAREVRLRAGGMIFDTGGQTLSSLLAAVCACASELGSDPELPLPDAILLQRLVVQLSRAARRAEAIEPADRQFVAQHPMHREDDAPDDRLTAWRNDHRTERDQRAHERLRTVIDERLIVKVKATNTRDRAEREAATDAA